jgi:predicted O-linked N-acetylglucosamine transferase (SPINDLY family)
MIEREAIGENTGEIDRAIQFYEEKIEAEPFEIGHYWSLGLAYLLAGREEDASATWLFVLGQGEEEGVETWTEQLVEVLAKEATRQEDAGNLDRARSIREQIRDIAPNDPINLCGLVELELAIGYFTPERIDEWRLVECIEASGNLPVPAPLLLSILEKILAYPDERILGLIRAISSRIPDPEIFIQKIISGFVYFKYQNNAPQLTTKLTEFCLEIAPTKLYLWDILFILAKKSHDYERALLITDGFERNCRNDLERIYARSMRVSILQEMGDWLNFAPSLAEFKNSIAAIASTDTLKVEPFIRDSLLGITSCLPYYQDRPRENRSIQNKLAELFENSVRAAYPLDRNPIEKIAEKKLKIAYIAHTLRRHSVGWLSRWLFQYHDREKFDITLILVNQPEDELTRERFISRVDRVYRVLAEPRKIAQTILQEKIDILIDLDSITNNTTYTVMALKPAPIQATWLGLDASGIPAIDYFIADRYVLPESAGEYYREKIIRLPNSYLSIDGFEVGVPTLRREMLGINEEAIVYLTVQSGLKRTPETIRSQMRIIQGVPDSYLLVKGTGDRDTIRALFTEIAASEGVSSERLRFLENDPTEEIHRANLTIADIVLDTYPYNGATTTLEVLWMGIPLVTRVGEQFAARNSYTFLLNAGISEGIAWSDAEYIEWGIRLGTDTELRKKVVAKIKNSRCTSSIWNARRFTRNIEEAYRQMWVNYITNLT